MKTFTLNSFRVTLMACLMVSLTLVSCKKDDDEPAVGNTNFRGVTINYNDLTATTPYNTPLFYNSDGDSTVDRTEGHNRLKMLRAIDAYGKTANNAGTATLYAATFNNMFANQNDPFTGIYVGLNDSIECVREVTATSKSTTIRDQVIDKFSSYFTSIANASLSVNNTASSGVAGKLTAASGSKYLVDEKGIEYIQIISKSYIGAFQLDYISNVLLNTGLEADNSQLVEGEKYTALEHNWDVAYGILTLNSIYCGNATTTSSGGESFLGSYMWEYHKTGYPQIHMAFLKGRAAIINNDMDEVRAQALIIRNIMERTIANAAVGYLGKWTTGADDAARAHAIGEGGGFIYSLRFCELNNADEAFSDGIISDLGLFTGNGFWDLTALKVNTAKSDIETQFGI